MPRDGVFARNGAGGFPIGAARCLQFGPDDGVVHTEFFAEPRTGAQLLDWLEPATGMQGRDLRGGPSAGPSAAEIARVLDTVRHRVLLELAVQGGRGLAGSPDFTPDELDKLRPHVVNLSGGTFQSSGIYSSTKEDVDAIVREQIPKWAGTLPAGEKLRIVIWAHGGLIGEKDGLRIAQKHVEWWKKNGVYPIYFVWETGLFDALRAILEQVRSKIPGLGGRDLFDFTSDPLIELGARALGGVHVWGAMKRNAELSSADSGGARYVAQQLAVLANTPDLHNGHEVELHAVGHSAGSIFHSWFLPAARVEHAPAFKTLQLLAPAITIEEFKARLAPEIGGAGAVEQAILFTMKRDYEEADNCAEVYRKSLLYLIHHALEPEKRTPVLGLEISLRADAAAAKLFGLQGAAGAPGRTVWSVTDGATGRSVSASVHHGDFDDDIATMSSVAANVLDEPDARMRYPGSPRDLSRGPAGDWPVSNDWLRGVDVSPAFGPVLSPAAPASASPPRAGIASPAGSAVTTATPVVGSAKTDGMRRALCIGIDAYKPPNTLQGCVNDTGTWEKTLGALGFKVDKLLDERATRQAIIDALTALVRSSKSGDVLVLQYSGHGTQVTDLDGDESDGKDEALVPYDFDSGAFLIDDDLRAVFSQLPEGVNLTCFIDCCHSGTITRMLGRNADESTNDGETRSRYLKPGEHWNEWMRAHERFRQRERAIRDLGTAGSRTFDANMMRWVDFSACDSTEVAYETKGNGDFTRLAAPFSAAPCAQHRDFQNAVIRRSANVAKERLNWIAPIRPRRLRCCNRWADADGEASTPEATAARAQSRSGHGPTSPFRGPRRGRTRLGEHFVIGARVLTEAESVRTNERKTTRSIDRSGSMRSTHRPRADGALAVVNVPYEPIEWTAGTPRRNPRNRGRLARTVAALGPCNLDEPFVLMQQGRRPSPEDGDFRQQMTYAVCTTPTPRFVRRLDETWLGDFGARAEQPSRSRLRMRPCVDDLQNAYYDPKRGELQFGAFNASSTCRGRNVPGGPISLALSHDVVVHEMSHALLDGMRSHFLVPSNLDVLAFHEAFADLIAIFQRFTYRDVVGRAIRASRGNMSGATLLTSIGVQFAQAVNASGALRTAVSGAAPPRRRDRATPPRRDIGRGSVQAFGHLLSQDHPSHPARERGTGVLPAGDIPEVLAALLTDRACRLASQFLTICIRAHRLLSAGGHHVRRISTGVITADTRSDSTRRLGIPRSMDRRVRGATHLPGRRA